MVILKYLIPVFRKIEMHFSKLTQQWKMDPLKMYFLLNMGIFHCYVSLLEGRRLLKEPRQNRTSI